MISVRDVLRDNFAEYTAVVADIAGRAKSILGRVLTGENDAARKSHFISLTRTASVTTSRRITPAVDSDGDTIISGYFLTGS